MSTIILLGFWQLTTFSYTLKWDALDISLPWRYYVIDAFRNGIVPFWNPYQLHGFAQGTSPETWYPIASLLGILRGYGFYSLNIEYLIHLLIASWGIFRFCRHFGRSRYSSTVAALIFPMSGFFIGHAQHLGWIVAGAWIPHVLTNYLIFRTHLKWSKAFAFVICFFCLASGGYPGMTIVTMYILGGIFVADLIKNRRRKYSNAKYLVAMVRLFMLCLLSCALLIAVFLDLKHNLARGEGLTVDAGLIGSYEFKFLISLLFPFTTVKSYDSFWNAEQSIMNIYMGIPVLLLLLMGLRSFRKDSIWWILALLSLALALAKELPIRGIANHLPLWDLFRFPSLFRYFTILCLLMVATATIDRRSDNVQSLFRHLRVVALPLMVSCGIIFLYFLVTRTVNVGKVLRLSIDTAGEALILQSLTACVLLAAIVLLPTFFGRRNHLRMGFLMIAALDVFVATQLNGRVSVFSDDKLSTMQECLAKLPQGFPLPSLLNPLGSNSDRTLHFGQVYRNTHMLFKEPSWDGYSPYQYNGYIAFDNSPYYEKSLEQGFAFLSHHDTLLDHGFYRSRPLTFTNSDSIRIVSFNPNRFEFDVVARYPRILILNQNYLPKWRAFAGDHRLEVIRADQNLTGVKVPQGAHRIRVEYHPGPLLNTLYISVASLFLVGIAFLYLAVSGWWIFGGIIAITLLIISGYEAADLPVIRGSDQIINQVDQLTLFDSTSVLDRFLDWRDFHRFRAMIKNQSTEYTYRSRSTCQQDDIFWNYLVERHAAQEVLDKGSYRSLMVKPNRNDIFLSSYNAYEGYAKGWRDLGREITLEKNGNRYQKISELKFSATWSKSVRFDSITSFRLKLAVRHRGTNATKASLVFALLDQYDQVIESKSYALRDGKEEEWTKTQWQRIITIPKGDHIMRAYIWNPQFVDLHIDEFEVVVERL